MRVWAALLIALAASTGCADAALEGSLGTIYPIEFDSLRLRLYSSSVSVEYVKIDGSVPIRVTTDRETAMNASPGMAVDLLQHGDVTGRTSDDREIPRFSEGSIVFEELSDEMGGLVRGSFTAKFPAGETDVLGLKGLFDGALELVTDPGPPPPATDE